MFIIRTRRRIYRIRTMPCAEGFVDKVSQRLVVALVNIPVIVTCHVPDPFSTFIFNILIPVIVARQVPDPFLNFNILIRA